MKVCVYGAGAVGGQMAGRLASAGAQVSLVERGSQLEALRTKGLRVETAAEVLQSRPNVTDDPETLGPQDAVIVALKAPTLPLAAAGIASLLGPDTIVVFINNGIPWWYFHALGGPLGETRLPQLDPEGVIWERVAPPRIVGAVAYTASTVVAPGVVRATNVRNRLVLGRPDGHADSRLDALAELLRAGGLEVEITTTIRDAIWAKLVLNLVGGAIAILTTTTTREALGDANVMAAATKAAEEAAAVAVALGSRVDDVSDTLERLRASAHKQSILQDLEAGRPMEVDALLVAPLALARMADVATPVLDVLVGLAVQRARAAGLYATLQAQE